MSSGARRMAPARSWRGRFPLVRQVAALAATAGLLLAVSLGLWLSSHGAGALLCATLASVALVCSAIGAATCSGVDRRARRMAAASGAAHAASGTMLVATGRQSERVDLVAAAVGELLGSIRAVSKAASDAAAVARRSLDAAAKGAGAANDTIRGMVDIRTQIQDTSKRIKRLGERSQEIGEIVELIADISEQTTLLALNASIQAAAAGEAGRGFSLVAEEVQQLAERSAEATRAIAGLVKSIQNDTIDAMVAMERSIADVVEGARRADSAGRALDEIQQVTHQQSALIDAISGASTSQRAVTARIADHMDDVRRLTHDVGDGASATARAVADLDSLTGDLRGSISGVRP